VRSDEKSRALLFSSSFIVQNEQACRNLSGFVRKKVMILKFPGNRWEEFGVVKIFEKSSGDQYTGSIKNPKTE
jgi:hypothetical protein